MARCGINPRHAYCYNYLKNVCTLKTDTKDSLYTITLCLKDSDGDDNVLETRQIDCLATQNNYLQNTPSKLFQRAQLNLSL